jgi:hypothetical protein
MPNDYNQWRRGRYRVIFIGFVEFKGAGFGFAEGVAAAD